MRNYDLWCYFLSGCQLHRGDIPTLRPWICDIPCHDFAHVSLCKVHLHQTISSDRLDHMAHSRMLRYRFNGDEAHKDDNGCGSGGVLRHIRDV